jgi:hypothetical protein
VYSYSGDRDREMKRERKRKEEGRCEERMRDVCIYIYREREMSERDVGYIGPDCPNKHDT